jgi:hypothetical protein
MVQKTSTLECLYLTCKRRCTMRIKLNDNDTKLITETVKKIVHLVDEARDPEFLTRKVLEAIQQEYPAV